MFPTTHEEFAALNAVGKTVEYEETEDAETQPDGDGWALWSTCTVDGQTTYVWRRIVDLPLSGGIL